MKRILVGLVMVSLLLSGAQSAFAADTAPPQLVDWTLGTNPLNPDISKTDAAVTVKFILSDDSEIEAPHLLLKSLSSTQMTGFAKVKEISRSGKLVSYEASALIKFGQSPGIWEWVLYPLGDVLGNTTSIWGPGSPWSSEVTVLDSVYTQWTLMCDQQVRRWNSIVQNFLNLESKYGDAQELAILRLKFPVSIELLPEDTCTSLELVAKRAIAYNDINLQDKLTSASMSIIVRINTEREVAQLAAEELFAKQEADAKATTSVRLKDELNTESVKLSNLIDKLLNTTLTASKKNELKSIKSNLTSLTIEFNGINLLELQNFNMYKTSLSNLNIKYLKVYPAISKKTTITCVKGKLTKKVTAVKPVCPKGYKKK